MTKSNILLLLFLMLQNIFTVITYTFLSSSEVSKIKEKISNNEEPWKSSYTKLLSDADSQLSLSPKYVSNNEYNTMKPYDWSNNMPSPCGSTSCDGMINPLADREDYSISIDFSAAVRDLGMAYAFSSDSKYADKAIGLIYSFCLDPEKYMKPNYFGSQAEKEGFKNWVKAFADEVATKHFSNNWETWRQVFVSSAGSFLNDVTLLNNAFDNFKNDINNHIDSKGLMIKEYTRTKGLSYSMYSLNAITQVCEIARHNGIDLYGYTTKIEIAWEYNANFAINPSSWTYQQIASFTGENCALYELAYRKTQNTKYLDVINKYGRPMVEIRIMGITSLTHSYGAYEDIIYQNENVPDDDDDDDDDDTAKKNTVTIIITGCVVICITIIVVVVLIIIILICKKKRKNFLRLKRAINSASSCSNDRIVKSELEGMDAISKCEIDETPSSRSSNSTYY